MFHLVLRYITNHEVIVISYSFDTFCVISIVESTVLIDNTKYTFDRNYVLMFTNQALLLWKKTWNW